MKNACFSRLYSGPGMHLREHLEVHLALEGRVHQPYRRSCLPLKVLSLKEGIFDTPEVATLTLLVTGAMVINSTDPECRFSRHQTKGQMGCLSLALRYFKFRQRDLVHSLDLIIHIWGI